MDMNQNWHLLRRTITGLATFAIAIAWLIPNHYPPWLSFYNESCMALGLLLLAICSAAQRPQVAMPVVAWVVLGVAAIPWLHFAAGSVVFSGDAWVSSLYLLGLACAVAIGYQYASFDRRELALLLAVASLIAACVSSVLALQQSLSGGVDSIWGIDGAVGMQATANLGQPNNLATLIGFGLIGLFLLFEFRHLGRTVSFCLLGLMLLGIGLTRSRTALLYGPVIIVCMLLYLRRVPTGIRTPLGTVVLATVAHWGISALWPFMQEALMLPTVATLGEKGLQSSRWQTWVMFFDALNDRPWFGYGWMQTGAAQLDVALRHPSSGELFLQTHNMFLDLLLWCGYPLGSLLVLAIVYWGLCRGLRVATKESLAGVFTVAVFGVHCMLELPHQYAYFLIPVGLWIGLIEDSVSAPAFLATSLKYGVLIVTSALLALFWKDYPKVEADFRLFRFEQVRIGPVQAAQLAPNVPLFSALTTYVRVIRSATPDNRKMSAEQLLEMRQIVRRFPYITALYAYSLALARNGDTLAAKGTLVTIRRIFGEEVYGDCRRDLRGKISAGEKGLTAVYELLDDER